MSGWARQAKSWKVKLGEKGCKVVISALGSLKGCKEGCKKVVKVVRRLYVIRQEREKNNALWCCKERDTTRSSD